MKKYLIDYLNEQDKSSLSYANVNKSKKGFIYKSCSSVREISDALREIRSDEATCITILAHGGETGISNLLGAEYNISYQDLLDSLTQCKGKYALHVNLTSVCNSQNVLNYTNSHQKLGIELWVVNTPVGSIELALRAVAMGFTRFKTGLSDEDYPKYLSFSI